ncbi:MAG: phosphoribosylformylglycinamidine synthase subunit PurS [Thermovenabulum sp.]|uniref:phosphoribosylformylglycinamidine synthase subunit PurS n=1 Tax=Thermovenabulum sp. TaxID=3100335 RepID=UPI003C7AFF0B
MYKAEIKVFYKEGVLDPQGQAVKGALHHLGFLDVKEVRIGKVIFLTLESKDKGEAEEKVKEMCESLLANPVIEDYSFILVEEER